MERACETHRVTKLFAWRRRRDFFLESEKRRALRNSIVLLERLTIKHPPPIDYDYNYGYDDLYSYDDILDVLYSDTGKLVDLFYLEPRQTLHF